MLDRDIMGEGHEGNGVFMRKRWQDGEDHDERHRRQPVSFA